MSLDRATIARACELPLVHSAEVHLTFAVSYDDKTQFERVAAAQQCSALWIELSSGTEVHQPMLTLQVDGASQHRIADVIAAMAANGYECTRIKIELPAGTDWEGNIEYYESHLKVVLLPEKLPMLQSLVAKHSPGGRMSKNNFSRDSTTITRFVTIRDKGYYRSNKDNRDSNIASETEILKSILMQHDFDIRKAELEQVVFDSKRTLDYGWCTEASRPPDNPQFSPNNDDWRERQRALVGTYPSAAEPPIDHPPTYVVDDHGKPVGTSVFDPALKHFAHGLRQSNPIIKNQALQSEFEATQRLVSDKILDTIASHSTWSQLLVLRGSALCAKWMANYGRLPGDLDFACTPQNLSIHDDAAKAFFHDFARAMAGRTIKDIELEGGAAFGEIWTYDRVPGTRIVFTWRRPGLPKGQTQIDVVFREPLFEQTSWLPLGSGGQIQAATPQISIAWKLLWIFSDMYPQAKDIYDVTLLIETFGTCPLPLLKTVLSEGRAYIDGEDLYYKITGSGPHQRDRAGQRQWLTNFLNEDTELETTDYEHSWFAFLQRNPMITASAAELRPRFIEAVLTVGQH